MPRLRRRIRARAPRRDLSLEDTLGLTIGPGPRRRWDPEGYADDVARLREAYKDPFWRDYAHRDDRLALRPWAFWAFDRAVPDALRNAYPNDQYGDALDADRIAWLAETGRLRRDELGEIAMLAADEMDGTPIDWHPYSDDLQAIQRGIARRKLRSTLEDNHVNTR